LLRCPLVSWVALLTSSACPSLTCPWPQFPTQAFRLESKLRSQIPSPFQSRFHSLVSVEVSIKSTLSMSVSITWLWCLVLMPSRLRLLSTLTMHWMPSLRLPFLWLRSLVVYLATLPKP
ncbi:hypothetical protein BC939DRAFT_465768, partial [Gamsiella multidivaricata]|uniref:uncharacterized protein n=1 Tax=Gamsiella multidivaricata TaxID=101098 RepID=UPI00221FB68A